MSNDDPRAPQGVAKPARLPQYVMGVDYGAGPARTVATLCEVHDEWVFVQPNTVEQRQVVTVMSEVVVPRCTAEVARGE